MSTQHADADSWLRAALAAAPLTVSEDRRQLAELARGYLKRADAIAAARGGEVAAGQGVRQGWRRLAQEQGWPGLAVDERYGGLGFGFAELAVVIEECGRVLAHPELVTTSVLGASLLTGGVGEGREYLTRLAAGDCVLAVAGGYTVTRTVAASAVRDGADWRLSGDLGPVAHAEPAHLLLVPGRTAQGTALFAVESAMPGLRIEPVPALDPTRPHARVRLTDAAARLICAPERFPALWRQARLLATVALAAEQVGGAERALEMTLGYVATREQFGRPIGSFQAVKHRCADLLVELQATRSATEFAVWAADTGHPCLPLAASIAKASASETFRLIAGETVQLHGGIGFTWEHDAHLYFRRAASDQVILGDAFWHRRRIAELLTLPGADVPEAA
jgi:alkylation response protein AidB-like acyl-CoA dehydrogenase